MRIHLLSCGSCKRQLDVTALQLGDEVCCVCDNVLVVGHPREVEIRGLSCGHCGGVIRADDNECGYCAAKLEAADKLETLLCPVCATRLPNDSKHCKACGVALRAAALPPIPRGGSCPRCKGDLRVHLLDDAEVIECGDCGGIWAERETFARMIKGTSSAHVDRGTSRDRSMQPNSSGPEARQGYIPCLQCGDLMQRRQFRYANRPSHIVLDMCKKHGIWFDAEELRRSLEFVREFGGTFDPTAADLGVAKPRPKGSYAPVKRRPPTEKRSALLSFDGAFVVEFLGELLVSLLD